MVLVESVSSGAPVVFARPKSRLLARPSGVRRMSVGLPIAVGNAGRMCCGEAAGYLEEGEIQRCPRS
jgi:hypothetical protein